IGQRFERLIDDREGLDTPAGSDFDPFGRRLERLIGERTRRYEHPPGLRIAPSVQLGVIANLHKKPARRLPQRMLVTDVPRFPARQQLHWLFLAQASMTIVPKN